MEILAFPNYGLALVNVQKAYVNYIKNIFPEGRPVRNGGVLITTLEGLSDAQILLLKVCGKKGKKKKIILNKGLTTTYCKPIQAYERTEWYVADMPAAYKVGMSNYTEMTRPADWVPPYPDE